MRKIYLSFVLFCLISLFAYSNKEVTGKTVNNYPIESIPFTQVKIEDDFWSSKIATNRKATIPHALKKCEETGRISNFAKAAGLIEGSYEGFHFNDSDVYKIVEGICYSLAKVPDNQLEAQMDKIVEYIAAAQEKDGYLHPFITMTKSEHRWKNPQRHELYSMGHLLEAAAAHYEITGKRTLLDVAIKLADRVYDDFNPETGTEFRPPEHQEIEIGLCRLYKVTRDEKYLKLAQHFLDLRGKQKFFNLRRTGGRSLYGEYAQDHKPVLEQDEAVGHAVRAVYMYSAMADVAALTGRIEYLKAIERIWENVASKKIYITGGIGASGGGEAFGQNYYLPNLTSYCETCAAIGNVFWNHRLFKHNGDAKYIDVMERSLYNGLISGISLDGKSFFYPNPLASYGRHSRNSWFSCACCPSNVVRFMPTIGSYIYAKQGDVIYVNLYAASTAKINLGKQSVTVCQKTAYPWDGDVKIIVFPENKKEFSLYLRIPGWAQNQPIAGDLYRFTSQNKQKVSLKINGQPVSIDTEKGYAKIKRAWKKADVVELNLPMPVRKVLAHQNVEDDRGKIALQRGTIVYCAEWPDNKDGYVMNFYVPDNEKLRHEYHPDLLGGIEVITGKAVGVKRDTEGKLVEGRRQDFVTIPYYSWANRGRGEMAVWLARTAESARPLPADTIVYTSKITVSAGGPVSAINDQLEPKNSNDHSIPYFHWWPHLGTKEWVQLNFKKKTKISSVKIYWFDDTGVGQCRVPDSWKFLYKEADQWKEVKRPVVYGVKKDQYNTTKFEPVLTDGVRLEIQLQEKFSAGILEIIIK